MAGRRPPPAFDSPDKEPPLADNTSSPSYSPKRTDSMIGPGVRFEGRIDFSGVLRVFGQLVGDVACPADPQGMLVIEPTGSVTGAVKVAHLVVKGRLTGPVEARQGIEVESGAIIDGDVVYRRLDVHPGGVVAGLVTPLAASETVPPAPAGRELPPAEPTASGGQPAAASDDSTAQSSAARINIYPEHDRLAEPLATGAMVTEAAEPVPQASVDAVPPTSTDSERAAADSPAPSAHAVPAKSGGWTAGRRAGVIAAVLVVVAAVWFGRASTARAPADAETPAGAAETPPAPAVSAPPSAAPAGAESPATSAKPDPKPEANPGARAVLAAPPAPAAERAEPDPGKVVAVRGDNPAKSAEIIFVITKEPAVLLRKKADDASSGSRMEIGRGRNFSVPVAGNELYRVASGRELQMFYQGRKVPPSLIESGGWMRFVPAGE